MTNLEYINSLPCSQRLKDRIIELTRELNRKGYLTKKSVKLFHNLFLWEVTKEGFEYWYKIDQSIINNTPIVE